MIQPDLADIQGNVYRHTAAVSIFQHSRPGGRTPLRAGHTAAWDRTEAADGATILRKPPITLNIGIT